MSEPENNGRPNRDAFHALLIFALIFALFLVALIIAAWNTRIAFLPLTPKATPAAVQKTSFTYPPAGVRKASGVFPMFTPASDAAVVTGLSCRPAEFFLYHPMKKSAARSAQPGSRMAVSLDHRSPPNV